MNMFSGLTGYLHRTVFWWNGKPVDERTYYWNKFCLCGGLNLPNERICKQCKDTIRSHSNEQKN